MNLKLAFETVGAEPVSHRLPLLSLTRASVREPPAKAPPAPLEAA